MSQPIYGRWFDAKTVPGPSSPDVWYVTAQRNQERELGTGAVITYTTVRAHLPGGHFPDSAEVWMRIPPPPWLWRSGGTTYSHLHDSGCAYRGCEDPTHEAPTE